MTPNWIQEAIEQFGVQLGLQDWRLNEADVARTRLASGLFFSIELVNAPSAEVLVWIGDPAGFEAPALLRKALRAAHFSAGRPMALQIALGGDGPDALLMSAVRVPERELTVHVLERCFAFLARWVLEVRGG